VIQEKHEFDCTIYRSLINGTPLDGICTCGYGWSLVRKGEGDWSEMYSDERKSITNRANQLQQPGLDAEGRVGED
jgi:hypothetical protein